MIVKSQIFDTVNFYSTSIPDDTSYVFEVFPNVFSDNRGSFSEVLKDKRYILNENEPYWFNKLYWIKQINRSKSITGTIRGCHAQKGVYCQAKLVESLTDVIYDIITDARPNSKSFGVSSVFKLDPEKQNKLYVPRGFLHAFVVPHAKSEAIFQYFCDNVFNKESEICVNPETLLPKVINEYKKINNEFTDLYEMFESSSAIYSEKDKNGLIYEDFIKSIKEEYNKTGKIWY